MTLRPGRYDVHHLRHCSCGAATCSESFTFTADEKAAADRLYFERHPPCATCGVSSHDPEDTLLVFAADHRPSNGTVLLVGSGFVLVRCPLPDHFVGKDYAAERTRRRKLNLPVDNRSILDALEASRRTR